MKYCSHCGKEVLDEAVICPNCGCSVQYDGFNKASGNTQSGAGQRPTYTPPPQPQPIHGSDAYSALCILGFVFAFLSPLVGLILSIVAYNESKRTFSQKSMSLSKAGIIVSAVLMGLFVFIYFMLMIVISPFWWLYIV